MNESINLYYNEGSSDKVYNVSLTEVDPGAWTVFFSYGRRGSTMTNGEKISRAPYHQAKIHYDKLVREKTGKGYKVASGPTKSTGGTGVAAHPIVSGTTTTINIKVMLCQAAPAGVTADGWLSGRDWWMQEKYDGERRFIRKEKGAIIGINRRRIGVPLPLDILEECRKIPLDSFLIDGEILGEDYRVFDILKIGKDTLTHLPFSSRIAKLEEFMDLAPLDRIMLAHVYALEENKRKALEEIMTNNREGVVFKHVMGLYEDGRSENCIKYKLYDTASCIVTMKDKSKRSVHLAVSDNGNEVDVGKVTIPPNYDVPNPGSIVEIRYLYAYPGGSLYQPIYQGVRTDVTVEDCSIKQLKFTSK